VNLPFIGGEEIKSKFRLNYRNKAGFLIITDHTSSEANRLVLKNFDNKAYYVNAISDSPDTGGFYWYYLEDHEPIKAKVEDISLSSINKLLIGGGECILDGVQVEIPNEEEFKSMIPEEIYNNTKYISFCNKFLAMYEENIMLKKEKVKLRNLNLIKDMTIRNLERGIYPRGKLQYEEERERESELDRNIESHKYGEDLVSFRRRDEDYEDNY
jgi:hypothetical protein